MTGFALELFEICLHLIATPFESLPGAQFDEFWNDRFIRASLFSLVGTIAGAIGRESLVRQLVHLISECTSETAWFVSLLRVLTHIMLPPLNIAREAGDLSQFLLSAITSFGVRTQNYICSLLSKLIDYLAFGQADLNHFFRQLFRLFISSKPAAFDPFTSYFTRFVQQFSSEIELPPDLLAQIRPGDSCYFIISSLISRLTGADTPIGHAVLELQWLITQFDCNDPSSLLRLIQSVSRSFEQLAFLQTAPEASEAFELIVLLIKCNNSLSFSAQDPHSAAQLLSSMGFLAQAILRFASFAPSDFLSVAHEMRPPLLLCPYASMWLKRIVLPLLDIVKDCDPNAVNAFVIFVISHFAPMITEMPEDLPVELHTVAKRVAVTLARLSSLVGPDDAIVVLGICLSLDDFRIFRAVTEVVFGFGLQMVARMWDEMVARQDPASVDHMAGLLFQCWRETGENFGVLQEIAGMPDGIIETVRMRVGNAATDRTKRKYFKMLVSKVNV
jgi:hypothetical protein